MRELGRRLRDKGGDPRSGFYLLQTLPVAVQRGNAASAMDQTRPGRKFCNIVGHFLERLSALRAMCDLPNAAYTSVKSLIPPSWDSDIRIQGSMLMNAMTSNRDVQSHYFKSNRCRCSGAGGARGGRAAGRLARSARIEVDPDSGGVSPPAAAPAPAAAIELCFQNSVYASDMSKPSEEWVSMKEQCDTNEKIVILDDFSDCVGVQI
ncbi:hypothetical protein EVAR_96066_1 [Eumeta japonica]|uniref:Uncharacterized protein n=1 Tax=Eumeta variegata TaxID=151549 RepID=A0A4C1W7R1_EUMVA|nr:hypothetical protein EVAR_96066_1 [Eumeta japonica]